MTIEKLKELLEAGKLTQEEYDAMAKVIGEPEPKKDDPLDSEALRKLIQQEVDRATNKLGNENKDLRQKLKEKMTAEEVAKLEKEEREKELAERERALKDKESRLYAIQAIKEAGLDDGSANALALIDFVIADDEESMKTKVGAFKTLVDQFVKAKVDETFKKNGGTPAKGDDLNGQKNPYKAETYNLTEQMVLEQTNPELAKRLRELAQQ